MVFAVISCVSSKSFSLSILGIFIFVLPVQGQDIVPIDQVYDEYKEFIKTVRLFPLLNKPDQEMLSAAMPLSNKYKLILEFDDLFAEYEQYSVKFIHCNADWSQSRLFPLDYLSNYNEFPIENYDFSFNTRVPYVHYNFVLPRFKIPGNYLLVVYRDSEDDIVLTKRFVVFSQQIEMKENFENAGLSRISGMTQEIQFTLNYSGSNISNPIQNVKATIKQNQRWDNAIVELRPTNVWETSRIIEYRHFAMENQFKGGNQFRFFDLRSVEYFGRNVDKVDLTKEIPVATLQIDRSRNAKPYSEYRDNNGKYTISHPVNAEYAYTMFFIETEEINGSVILAGDFTYWEYTGEFQMKYSAGRNGYFKSIMLKEGFYDYQYLVNSKIHSANHLEGDHFETENEYEILIYYYSFELNTDLLIGYFPITKNPRY